MPVPFALEYMVKVLGALEYAHSHEIIHRDITPENVIITPEGDVKLTGFGLAKTQSDPALTQAGTMLGSLHYISPEQVKGLPTIDARTDIYAAGVILYELVTGAKPFAGQSQFDGFHKFGIHAVSRPAYYNSRQGKRPISRSDK